MRVTHFIRRIWTNDGGSNRAVLDMALYQARAGCEVAVAAFDDRDIPHPWRACGPGVPRVVRLDRPLRRAVGLLPRAQVDGLLSRTDVLHFHDLWEPGQVALARAARRHAKPYILTPHGMLNDWSVRQKRFKKFLYTRLFGARLLAGASFIHLTARAELEQSQRRHPRTPGTVIPLIFDLDPYRAEPDPAPARRGLPLPSPDRPSILYLSRLHEKKRPDLVIRAAAGLRRMGLDFHVVIAGPGAPDYRAGLEQLVRDLSLSDHVRFLGMVPEELKPSLFAACDLFVLPTQMENFGFVYFESLACGTPLVTTRGTDTWRELQDTGAARIVGDPATTPDELAGAIAPLIADRPALRAMGRSGRRWVLDHLEPSRVVPQFVSMYQRAIDPLCRP